MRIFSVVLMCLLSITASAQSIDARQLVLDAMVHWRGTTSHAQMTMNIHRPGWQRSMMAQGWMGGDFSNRDISKATDIIDQYEHSLKGIECHDGRSVYRIESIPRQDAAVVWGKEILFIRDDYVLLEHQFSSQDGTLVKVMKTLEVREMGGRQVASIVRMSVVDHPGEWTQLSTIQIEFGIELPANPFTLSNLRNPRL